MPQKTADTIKFDLPKVSALSVREVASQWQCSEERIITYMRDGLLIPVVRLYDTTVRLHWSLRPSYEPNGEILFDEYEEPDFQTANARTYFVWSYRYQRKYLDNETGHEYIFLEESFLTDQARPTKDHSGPWIRIVPASQKRARYFSHKLLVPQSEIDRLETFAGKAELGPSERKYLLKALALLTRMFVEAIAKSAKPEDYGINDDKGFGTIRNPIVDRVVKAALQHLENSDEEQLETYGIGESTLNEKIGAGLKLLKGELL